MDAASPMSYRLNGKVLTKLGRGQPEVVSQALGIREVELDEEKMRLNFQKQMSYPFLLDKTPSQMFKFIVQSAEEDNLMEVIDTMKTDLNTSYANIKQYESSKESLKQATQREAKKYKDKKPCVPYCDRVIEMESKVKKLQRLLNLIESYQSNLDIVKDNTRRLEMVELQLGMLTKSIDAVKGKVEKSAVLSQRVSGIMQRAEEKDQIEVRVRQVDTQLERYSRLPEYLSKMEELREVEDKAYDLRSSVESIESLETSIDELVSDIESKGVRLETLKEIEFRVDNLCKKRDKISVLVVEIGKSQTQLQGISEEQKIVDGEIASVEEEISSFDICPFCNNKIGGHHEH